MDAPKFRDGLLRALDAGMFGRDVSEVQLNADPAAICGPRYQVALNIARYAEEAGMDLDYENQTMSGEDSPNPKVAGDIYNAGHLRGRQEEGLEMALRIYGPLYALAFVEVCTARPGRKLGWAHQTLGGHIEGLLV